MLMFESHWMPFSTPETAERMKQIVRMVMIAMSTPLPALPMPPTISTPLLICSAPSPREAAEPKRVAKMARMSMTLPPAPWACLPSSGSNAALISESRPLRKTPYASAMPTTA